MTDSHPKSLLNLTASGSEIPGAHTISIDLTRSSPVVPQETLPFASDTIDAIVISDGLEKLTQAAGLALFRECRRVLQFDGELTVATVDLSRLVDVHKPRAWSENWTPTQCEKINMTEHGLPGRWLYTDDGLRDAAKMCGLRFERRVDQLPEPFDGFRLPPAADLAMCFTKALPDAHAVDNPLVSIVIPSYTADYFEEALHSAINQTYSNIEVIIGDDCPIDAIEKIATELGTTDDRIQYLRNPGRLGCIDNFCACFDRTNGQFIKFLNDDDVLMPTCVELMVRCLQRYPNVSLVTSHRQVVSQTGTRLVDFAATRQIVAEDSLFSGLVATNAVMASTLNFIGEPSTPLFRKADMVSMMPGLFDLGGIRAKLIGDIYMWINLLSRGDLIYISETLSHFRQHDNQLYKSEGSRAQGHLDWQNMDRAARRLGQADDSWPAKLTGSALPIPAQWPDEMVEIIEQAKIALSSQNWDQARKRLIKADTIVPGDSWVTLSRGEVMVHQGNSEKGRKMIEMLIENRPNYIDSYLSLAALEIESDALDKAMIVLNQGLAQQPEHVALLTMAGRLYLDRGEIKEAARSAAAALRVIPKHVPSLLVLGEVYKLVGDNAKALAYVTKAAQLDPKNDQARAALADLRSTISR